MPTNCRGFTRSTSAAAIVARKQAVPDALSQFSVKTAAYGAGAGVTGGTRVIALCSPVTITPFSPVGAFGRKDGIAPLVHVSSASLIDGSPHARTNITSNKYGLQAT